VKPVFIALLFLFTMGKIAIAQTAGTTSTARPPSIPERDAATGTVTVVPEVSTASQRSSGRGPYLTGLVPYCVRINDITLIRGENLSAMETLMPALRDDTKLVFLDLLNKTDTQMTVKISAEGVVAGKSYELVLADTNKTLSIQNTKVIIRICQNLSEQKEKTTLKTRDILIFAKTNNRIRILQELGKRSLLVIEEFELLSLGRVMIRVSAVDAQSLLADLRRLFPDAAIDLDQDLTASQQPRLFAQKKIAWPRQNKCLLPFSDLAIGLIDGAIDQGHAAFAGQKIRVKSFLTDAEQDMAHATAIASILIGNAPAKGLEGLLTGARLYNAVVLRQTRSAQQLARVSAIIKGLDWLLIQKVRLIDISLATSRPNDVLKAAIVLGLQKGAIIFAAAGNQGPAAPPAYPAAIEGVFAVTAIDAADRIYTQANQGAYIDFAAPGVDIWVAMPGKGGTYRSGTSFAAPYALAVAARYQQKNPSISRSVLKLVLSQTVKILNLSKTTRIFGAGLLQARC